MKIKLDENLPAGLIEALTKLGHDVEAAVLSLASHTDSQCI